ncbi:sensor histidine kinase [Microtetraspora glauca]|uniref:histidine kinase n=1 Tax=Microtetraspora glauca TaxID=1996 RepID=A0ABV3GIM4_MICGL
MRARLLSLLAHPTRPSLGQGIIVAAACLAVEILIARMLWQIAPSGSLGVVYLLGILLVSTLWGLPLGILTVLASGVAFEYFDFPPKESFTLPAAWAVSPLPIFLVVGLLVAGIASMARSLAVEADERRREADERRREADLAADLAHLLLRSEDSRAVLPVASERLARALRVDGVAIEGGAVEVGDDRHALPLGGNGEPLATVTLPADAPEAVRRRLSERIIPSLEALLQTARDRETIASALQASRDENRRIAEEQAALRRVATLVARGISPTELFNRVAQEVCMILGADRVAIGRYDTGRMTVVGSWSLRYGTASGLPIGSQWPLEEPSVSARVRRILRPARVSDYGTGMGKISEWARDQGVTVSVGCPILVEARLWGVVIAFSVDPEPTLRCAEERMRDFTDLVATAISNAQVRADLAASRARVVAAADESRRRIERNLHDGAQQQLVSLALELRAAEAGMPPEQSDARKRLTHALNGLTGVMEDLQELSRGIHPAILTNGGVGPALRMLARRSAIPVELDIRSELRLPERVEVAVYYVTAETLTNVVKHARASVARVAFWTDGGAAHLTIEDDGVGGADLGSGSGLLGISDRVEALDGTVTVISPAGAGTTLSVTIPLTT